MDFAQQLALVAPVLLFAMVAHEYAHGYAAYRQGDMTAYQLGRLTWNPIRHIDPFMTVILPVMTYLSTGMIFGGAKPVPVTPRNYRNYKRGDIIVSLAGVVTNGVIAALCVPVAIMVGLVGADSGVLQRPLAVFQQMLLEGIRVNLFLAFFNLLPIPPLDGSHVFKYVLPPAWSIRYQSLGGVGLLVLIAILYLASPVVSAWMAPAKGMITAAYLVIMPYLLPNPFAG